VVKAVNTMHVIDSVLENASDEKSLEVTGNWRKLHKPKQEIYNLYFSPNIFFFSFSATAQFWALAYLHEIFRFTSVY
jgi:hypothetical protein